MPLMEGSSALDTAIDAACPTTDARGVVRPIGPHCDIGAYEYDGPIPHLYVPLVTRN